MQLSSRFYAHLLSAGFVFLGMLGCITSANAQTATIGSIESLIAPAFLDRGGLSVPASAGIGLLPGDRLRTGAGGRLLLKLAEGSAVRLGENATFVLESAKRKGLVFEAALSVVQGAFRFTTAVLAKAQPRDVRISVARNATIGIRGTDVWGRGRDDKDIVCLIEGKIDVTGNDNQVRKLDQPLQFFQSKRDTVPEPLSYVDPKQLGEWAKETDIPPGSGASTTGVYKVVIRSFASRDALLKAHRTLRDAGYAFDKSGDTLVLSGLINEMDANAIATQLASFSGFKEVRVER